MKVRVEDLVTGCIIQKDIIGKTNNPIFPEKLILTDKHIEFMKAFVINEVDIQSKLDNGEAFKNAVIEEEGYSQKENSFSHYTSSEYYTHAVELFKKEFQSWRSGVGINISNIRAILLPLFEKLQNDKNWIRKIHLYSKKQDYLFHHSIAVSMISGYIAKEMGYDKGQCLQIAIAGCLADCGMAKMPPHLLIKSNSLTSDEWAEIKKHPIYSYQMVKNISLLKQEIKLAILQHHERLDGSGYPLGEKGKKIQKLSQIIAVADIYHAMTTDRTYKSMQSPFRTLQIMKEDQFGKLNISILKVLISAIASLPVGTIVEISNKKKAEIIFTKPDALTRPLVKIVDTGEMIDLEKNRNLYIESVHM